MTTDERSTAEWQAADRVTDLHLFTDYKALRERGSTIITRGEGCSVWDSDGNRYRDGLAGLACVNIGYGRGELADAAARQMRELSYFNSFFKSSNVPAIRLAEKLGQLTPAGLIRCSTPTPAPRRTTRRCAWCAATGSCAAGRSAG